MDTINQVGKSKIVNASMFLDALKNSGYKGTDNAVAELVDNSFDADNYDDVEIEIRKNIKVIDLNEIVGNVIKIPEYVTVIETGVFDGLTDVVIQTEYESKPDEWEEGWNGNCPVEWGVKF